MPPYIIELKWNKYNKDLSTTQVITKNRKEIQTFIDLIKLKIVNFNIEHNILHAVSTKDKFPENVLIFDKNNNGLVSSNYLIFLTYFYQIIYYYFFLFMFKLNFEKGTKRWKI